ARWRKTGLHFVNQRCHRHSFLVVKIIENNFFFFRFPTSIVLATRSKKCCGVPGGGGLITA
ncbi:MAG TPA: hypothetical protein PK527_03455, partial [Smithellaceae bacterium]|nr:hypothetical protein [Smithellaceae bacterium]HQB92196.1 hypothetical protein [Smithellaceae bacterium]